VPNQACRTLAYQGIRRRTRGGENIFSDTKGPAEVAFDELGMACCKIVSFPDFTKLAGRASFAGERAAGQLRSVDHAITAERQQTASALAFFLEAFDLSLDQLADEGCTPLRPDQCVDTSAQTFRQADNGRLHSKRWASHGWVVSGRHQLST
jgi:hypothetical protein